MHPWILDKYRRIFNKGEASVEITMKQMVPHFGSPDSPYQVALAKRADKKYPVPGPWINGGVIQFLKNKVVVSELLN